MGGPGGGLEAILRQLFGLGGSAQPGSLPMAGGGSPTRIVPGDQDRTLDPTLTRPVPSMPTFQPTPTLTRPEPSMPTFKPAPFDPYQQRF